MILDSQSILDLKDEVEALLGKLGMENNMVISIERFDAIDHLKGEMVFSILSKDVDRDLYYWNMYCNEYGLKADDYDKVISIFGGKYILKSIQPDDYLYPVIVENTVTGQRIHSDVDKVKKSLEQVEN